jgi:hypothetical protein
VEGKLREYTHGMLYQNLSPGAAAHLARTEQAIVTCCYWKNSPAGTEALLSNGAALVLHDPTELVPELMTLITKYRPRIIAIRANNVAFFEAKGIQNVRYVPHPYVPVVVPEVDRFIHAIAACRVDFDKYTHEIVSANKLLPTNQRVRVYGVVNRLYAFHKLAKAHPDWEEHYYGDFPKTADAAVRLLSNAGFAVDLSRIAGDGGGTQYSFLEAWNAGCQLIVHRGWLRDGGELEDGVNCTAVGSPEELAAALHQPVDPVIVLGGAASLASHAPDRAVPAFMGALQ